MPVVYDCRKEGREPGAHYFPCNVRVLDPQTGQRIENVFLLCDSPAKVGRFIVDANGVPLVNPNRKRRFIPDGRGGKKLEIYYDRLETVEYRPWVAVRLHTDGSTGEVVAKSEGAP